MMPDTDLEQLKAKAEARGWAIGAMPCDPRTLRATAPPAAAPAGNHGWDAIIAKVLAEHPSPISRPRLGELDRRA